MLDFRIDTFLAVCAHMNYTKAAEELSITQPAVSQHIRYLEETYQTRLFQHRGKKIELTAAGRLFLSSAITMKHDDLRLREKLAEVSRKKNRLNFGVTLTIGEYVMPGPIASYLQKYPDTAIRMLTANTSELLKRMNSSEIDFALVEGYFPKEEYDSLVYSRERYIGVCRKDYSFHKKVRRIEDLLPERVIIREPGSGTREIWENVLESKNLGVHDFRNVVEIGNIDAIKQLVGDGLGITFLYQAAVQKELEEGLLAEIPLEDFHITHDFTFIWRKNSIFAEDYHELFELLAGCDTEALTQSVTTVP